MSGNKTEMLINFKIVRKITMNVIKQILAGIMIGWLVLVKPTFAEEPKQDTQIERVENKEESPINVNFKLNSLNRWISNGNPISEGSVIQSTLKANYKNLTIIGFGNYDSHLGKFNEMDLTLDVTKQLNEDLTLFGGYSLITVPNSNNTQEFYVGAALDNLLRPTICIAHDFDKGEGTYIKGGAGHDFKVGENTLSLDGVVGYNHHYTTGKNGFHNAEIILSSKIPLAKNVSLTPMVKYSRPLDDRAARINCGASLEVDF